jgi:hypothetical protein
VERELEERLSHRSSSDRGPVVPVPVEADCSRGLLGVISEMEAER